MGLNSFTEQMLLLWLDLGWQAQLSPRRYVIEKIYQ